MLTAIFAVVACGEALAQSADDTGDDARNGRPATEYLVFSGLGIALPTYILGVTLHEGSHAVAAKLIGVEVVGLKLLPGRHPRNKKFYFGYTEIRGGLSSGQRIFFLIAPKIVDIVMLGSYAALIGFDALPENHYGQLALAVVATGFWIDFSKDIPPVAEYHDMPRIYTTLGLRSEWSRLPLRLTHAVMSAAAGYAVYKGYARIFEDDRSSPMAAASTWILPLARGHF